MRVNVTKPVKSMFGIYKTKMKTIFIYFLQVRFFKRFSEGSGGKNIGNLEGILNFLMQNVMSLFFLILG